MTTQFIQPEGIDSFLPGRADLIEVAVLNAGVPETLREKAIDYCLHYLESCEQHIGYSAVPPELLQYWPDILSWLERLIG